LFMSGVRPICELMPENLREIFIKKMPAEGFEPQAHD
jgi:hypothetical protein